jgi:hypothetical protein
LPDDPKPWYRQGHLLKLNFCILSLSLLCKFCHLQGSIHEPYNTNTGQLLQMVLMAP